MEEFAGAFGDADTVEVLDIYAASEEPIAGITGETLAGRIAGAAYAGSVGEAVARVVARAGEGDVVLTLGAGSVSQASGLVLAGLG
jgi:UDP-N-acetylmuramate--alanine ligase